MITKKQHQKICEKIWDVRACGVPVFTYAGVKVIGVDKEAGEIKLEDKTKITWRSYAPNTTLRRAWEKFHIPAISLYQVKRSRLLHSQLVDIAVAGKG